MDQFTVANLHEAIKRISQHALEAQELLCEADGQLGDGDLGISVSEGWQQALDDSEIYPDDWGGAFFGLSKSFQKASPSSFGTLMATAFMAAAKETKGKSTLTAAEISPLLTKACESMMLRGKGQLGQKSVLDIVDALAKALEGLNNATELQQTAVQTVDDTLDKFRPLPNQLGRARMFPEKSCGLDDPGMLAVKVMVEAL